LNSRSFFEVKQNLRLTNLTFCFKYPSWEKQRQKLDKNIKMKTHKVKFFINHTYHSIDPSPPWPLLASSGVFMLTLGLASWMHNFIGAWTLFLLNGLFLLLYIVSIWWRDVIREATFEEQHKITVRRGLRFGMILFIISEIMFFFALGGKLSSLQTCLPVYRTLVSRFWNGCGEALSWIIQF